MPRSGSASGLIDGVLFPVLALAFAFAARVGARRIVKPAVFKVAIPILISLVVIRLIVRDPEPALPRRALGAHPRAKHLVDRLDRGRPLDHRHLPLVLDAMEEVHWKSGTAG